MKLALLYIATIVIIYVIVDVIMYLVSQEGPRRLLKLMREALAAAGQDEALALTKTFHEEVLKWIENDRKLEYKCVWVSNHLAAAYDDIVRRWKGMWPEEFIAEMEKTASEMRDFYPRYVWTLFKAIVVAIVLALFIRAFLVQAFKIPSGSMIPTLYVGDQLLVNKFKYGIANPFTGEYFIHFWKPKRGDIIVFKPPRSVESSWVTHEIEVPFTDKVLYNWRSQVDFIKRIVGLPGDKVEVKDGILYVNDKPCELKELKEFDYKKKYGHYIRTVESKVFEERLNGTKHLLLHDSTERMRGDNFGPITVGPGEFFAMGDNRDDSADSRTWTGDSARLEDIRGQAFIIHFSWDQVENRPRFRRIFTLIR